MPCTTAARQHPLLRPVSALILISLCCVGYLTQAHPLLVMAHGSSQRSWRPACMIDVHPPDFTVQLP